MNAQKLAYPVQLRLQKEFNRRIMIKLGPKEKLEYLPDHQDIETPHHEMYDYDDGGGVEPVPDSDDIGDQHFDNYLNAEFLLPLGKEKRTTKFKRHKRNKRGNRMGRPHSNPILDTRVYDVELPDGTEK